MLKSRKKVYWHQSLDKSILTSRPRQKATKDFLSKQYVESQAHCKSDWSKGPILTKFSPDFNWSDHFDHYNGTSDHSMYYVYSDFDSDSCFAAGNNPYL